MKKIAAVLCAAVACAGAAEAKTLVAYYSRSGNTADVARLIGTATGADVFEITLANPDVYPAEYRPMTEVAKSEIENGTYPEINATPDLTDYDTIFVGTPIWWGTMASPVRAFLSNRNWSGKTIVPFVTHGGGGAGTSFDDIAGLTAGATHLSGYSVYGGDANAAAVDTWLTEIGRK